jgi:NTE family protein
VESPACRTCAPPASVMLRVVPLLAVLAACAAPLQRATVSPAAPQPPTTSAPIAHLQRPAIGVAFGGGSARGIAHVGVIRWLEEHRIPIDVAAGTSMGGLVGGAFATGMDAQELQAFITSIDWDELFNASSFEHKNVRRKADARAYPSRLEFGVKGGVVPPTALNSGESVELLLARITAPYFDIQDFNDLPTPFRTVSVDLLSAKPVIMRNGSLADAMRATMSLPLAFPPVDVNGQLLVDGGAMNNVPADVARAAGADRVIAINVGDLSDRQGVNSTMFGVTSETIDAMMRATSRRAVASADVLINVPLKEYGSLDWRRAGELIEEGYRAAEAMKAELLPFAVSETEYEAWRSGRQARRRTQLPVPTFVQLDGFAGNDTKRLTVLLARHVNVPVDVAAIEQDIAIIGGLDRYQTVAWRLVRDPARGVGLRVFARPKPYAPPFLMLGLNVENTTSSDFRVAMNARYLAFDVVGSGSELRIDGTLGSDPQIGMELYRPFGSTPLFVAPYAKTGRATFDITSRDAVIARYSQKIQRAGAAFGVNVGAASDVRLDFYIAHRSASIDVGNPGFPELHGKETGLNLLWRLDTQDSPVVPSRGTHSRVQLSHVFDGADLEVGGQPASLPFDTTPTQLSGVVNRFWSAGPRNRLFAYGGLGTSFSTTPLPFDQFLLGTPFRLGAYSEGELRGPHYYVATGGALRQFGRLPDFLGGPIFVGAWLENGDAFQRWRDATWRSNGGIGLVMDTLLGPVVLAGSFGFDGRWRTYVAVGRAFE